MMTRVYTIAFAAASTLLVAGCGLSSPATVLPDLTAAEKTKLIAPEQRAAEIRALSELSEDHQRRAEQLATVDTAPLRAIR